MQWGGSLDAQESWGQSPLAVATLKSRLHSMRTLVRLGASTEVADYHHKHTPLHIACGSMDEECVLLLLDASADVHAVNDKGQSALGVALTNRFYRAVPLLLEYGAKLNAMDRCYAPELLQEYIDEKTGIYIYIIQGKNIDSDLDSLYPWYRLSADIAAAVSSERASQPGT